MVAKTDGIVSVDNAWQSVSLEERLELISRAHATGVLASVTCVLLLGSIAYGFDKIWILAAGAAGALFVFPLFSSYSWRREKPALILAYLACRAVARRYAYGYSMPDIDIVFIYRAQMKEVFRSKEEEMLFRQRQKTDLDTGIVDFKDVWIVLFRGGLVVMSEKTGGAKLEFLTYLTHETVVREPTAKEEPPDDRAMIIEGVGAAKGRMVMVTSRYPAAHYVFEKRLDALLEEHKLSRESLEKLRSTG